MPLLGPVREVRVLPALRVQSNDPLLAEPFLSAHIPQYGLERAEPRSKLQTVAPGGGGGCVGPWVAGVGAWVGGGAGGRVVACVGGGVGAWVGACVGPLGACVGPLGAWVGACVGPQSARVGPQGSPGGSPSSRGQSFQPESVTDPSELHTILVVGSWP